MLLILSYLYNNYAIGIAYAISTASPQFYYHYQKTNIMKKFYILLCSIALIAGTALAQEGTSGGQGPGDGSGSAQGPGPHGNQADVDLSTITDESVVAAITAMRELRADRDAEIAKLGEGATPEEIHEALTGWREANADRIASVKANAQLVRDYFRAQRPDREGLGQTDGMKRRRAEFRDDVAEMRKEQKQLRLQLQDPDLTDEEREALIQAFRDENRETMQKLKARKRYQRLEGDGGGGDRRTGPEG